MEFLRLMSSLKCGLLGHDHISEDYLLFMSGDGERLE